MRGSRGRIGGAEEGTSAGDDVGLVVLLPGEGGLDDGEGDGELEDVAVVARLQHARPIQQRDRDDVGAGFQGHARLLELALQDSPVEFKIIVHYSHFVADHVEI